MPGILQVFPGAAQLLLRNSPRMPHAACRRLPPQLLFILVGVVVVGVGANGLPYIKMHSAAAQTINMNLRVRQQPCGMRQAACCTLQQQQRSSIH